MHQEPKMVQENSRLAARRCGKVLLLSDLGPMPSAGQLATGLICLTIAPPSPRTCWRLCAPPPEGVGKPAATEQKRSAQAAQLLGAFLHVDDIILISSFSSALSARRKQQAVPGRDVPSSGFSHSRSCSGCPASRDPQHI